MIYYYSISLLGRNGVLPIINNVKIEKDGKMGKKMLVMVIMSLICFLLSGCLECKNGENIINRIEDADSFKHLEEIKCDCKDALNYFSGGPKNLFNKRKEKIEYLANNPDRRHYSRYILKGSVVLGMTKEEVILSFGHPYEINKTVNSYEVREQWVYYNYNYQIQYRYGPYFYFTDGILTTWQD